MKKFFILLLLVLFTASINVDANEVQSEKRCLNILTNEFSRDSQAFQVDLSTLNLRDYGNDHLAKSIKVIRELLKDLGCRQSAINFGSGPFGRTSSRCTQFVGYRPSSRVCYIETNLGYFFAQEDYLDHMNIIFNRYD